jgi:hypothetical protein
MPLQLPGWFFSVILEIVCSVAIHCFGKLLRARHTARRRLSVTLVQWGSLTYKHFEFGEDDRP